VPQRLRALDPDWRPPDQMVGTDAFDQPIVADQLASDQALIAAAEARLDEFRHQRMDFPGDPTLDPSNLEAKANYALNPANPGAPWFKEVLGFDLSNWQQLTDQIYFDEKSAIPRGNLPEGPTFKQVISMRGANRNVADVRVGFIRSWSNVVRVTTIMPGRSR
jgi:hypothetical protein